MALLISLRIFLLSLALRLEAFRVTHGLKFYRFATRSSQINMVFEFLRQRTQEGLQQVQNIASKTMEGKLGEGLQDSLDYISVRRKSDAESFRRLSEGLARSRDRLLSGISGAFGTTIDAADDIDAVLSRLEEVLLQSDIGSSTTSTILSDLRAYARREKLTEDDILPVLRARLIEALTHPSNTSSFNFTTPESGEPTVIFVIGANGMGKTTTIGKIAYRLRNEDNMSVLLGACDTFRAAAVEQLQEWSLRANVSIELPQPHERGGDPVPVVTRTIQRAKREGFDVAIIDTSGRLSNNFELTSQLQEMKAAIVKEIPSAPHETLLVVDGSVGRNAVDQAAAWRKYVGVSGLVITKLDGTARGGFVVSVVRDLGLPVKFIGVGEKIADLRNFSPDVFVDALLGVDAAQREMVGARAARIMNVGAAARAGSAGEDSRVGGDVGSLSLSTSAEERLRPSFNSNGNSASSDSSRDSRSNAINSASVDVAKPKRPKRPKPQGIINKQKQK